jgi:ectoine hydroxylase-related dioxygenase (phytanoyl-CoA dioxygenase family)
MALPDPQITPAHARRFRDEGWFVIERALAPTELETLRRECRRLVDERDAEMTRLGVDTLDLCHRGRRYFLHAYATSPAVRQFLFSDLMADVAQAVLGDNVYLFNEQYVIKAAERGMPFGWHQDSAFIPYPHPPYLTCWMPLDDVSESNGTVHLLPYSRAGTHDVVAHQRDHETNDMIGYSGHDPGDPLIVPAGSIAAFSSTLFHRTGPNTSDHPRRVYIAQYTAEPLLSEDRSRPRHLAEPLLTAGHRAHPVGTTKPLTWTG